MAHARRKNWLARKTSRLRLFEDPLREAWTTAPEMVPLAGAAGDARPTVRLYVGTAPELIRATRTLVWSLAAVRDPSRAYEVHLMSNLKGVDRRGWRTGYEKYAAAVPRYAGEGARALYCDATTIFASDPATIFDEGETGVVDLSVGAPSFWSGSGAAALTEGAGVVDPVAWSASVGARSKDATPRVEQWRALEDAANDAGFLLFDGDRPTKEFGELIGLYERMHEENFFPGTRLKHHIAPVRDLIAQTGAARILDYGAGKGEGYDRIDGEPEESPWRVCSEWPDASIRCYDPGVPEFADIGDETFEGVLSTDVVEHLAPFDAPWVLRDMFARAERFVFVVAACYPAVKTLPDGRNAHTIVQPARWWLDQMALAGQSRPDVRWRLGCDMKDVFGKNARFYDGVGPNVA